MVQRCASAVLQRGTTLPVALVLNTPRQTRERIEALETQSRRREQLFELIAALGNCLDRAIVIETMQRVLGVDAVEKDNCAVFDDVAVRFGADGRVKCLYTIIDGSGPADSI